MRKVRWRESQTDAVSDEARGHEGKKEKTNAVKRSHGRDYKFARNHSFQLTQEKGNTVGFA